MVPTYAVPNSRSLTVDADVFIYHRGEVPGKLYMYVYIYHLGEVYAYVYILPGRSSQVVYVYHLRKVADKLAGGHLGEHAVDKLHELREVHRCRSALRLRIQNIDTLSVRASCNSGRELITEEAGEFVDVKHHALVCIIYVHALRHQAKRLLHDVGILRLSEKLLVIAHRVPEIEQHHKFRKVEGSIAICVDLFEKNVQLIVLGKSHLGFCLVSALSCVHSSRLGVALRPFFCLPQSARKKNVPIHRKFCTCMLHAAKSCTNTKYHGKTLTKLVEGNDLPKISKVSAINNSCGQGSHSSRSNNRKHTF